MYILCTPPCTFYVRCTHSMYSSIYILCIAPCTFYVQLHVHFMYTSMYILCTPPCTFYVHSILQLSFVLLCIFPRKVLIDTFVYHRALSYTNVSACTFRGNVHSSTKARCKMPCIYNVYIMYILMYIQCTY